jgi:hypothetical protein
MGANLIGELVANNGTYFIFGDGGYDGNVDQIIVRGNGILGIRIYVTFEDELLDVTDNYLSNGDETYLPNGTRITPQNNDVFTRVEIVGLDGVQSGLELVLA